MKKFEKSCYIIVLLSLTTGLIACSGNVPGSTYDSPSSLQAALGASNNRTYTTDALIFNGAGASDLDALSIKFILESHGLKTDMVDSQELNQMSVDEIANYGMIVVPGGYGGQMSRSLDPNTRERVRLAVIGRGVNYIGFCAGAFVAVGPTPGLGATPDYGFSILPAPQLLDYFYPYKDENDDVAASLPITFSDGTTRSILFWGGPALPEIPNGVVARYADGTPAIAQARSGNAFVTISGPHPEGPQSWKSVAGVTDPDGDDFDIAWTLFESTLKGKPVKAF